jgi:hypothetical protein
VIVGDKPRPLTATHWQIFVMLYRNRGDLDRIHVELCKGQDRPSAEPYREQMRLLRQMLAASRYQIVNHRTLGYELILTDASTTATVAPHV